MNRDELTRYFDSFQHPSEHPSSESMFDEFDASQLYCPQCKQAVPVRKSLLLILPDGDKYEYKCAFCGTSVGMKLDKKEKPLTLIG